MLQRSALESLAALHGLECSFEDAFGEDRIASDDSLIAMLRCLGAQVESAADIEQRLEEERSAHAHELCEPVLVASDRSRASVPLTVPPAFKGSYKLEADPDAGEGFVLEGQLNDLNVAQSLQTGKGQLVKRLLPLPVLEHGYCRLVVEVADRRQETLLLVPPSSSWAPHNARSWGVFAPLYALHSEKSLGAGDLGDLDALVEWCQDRGGSFVGTLPLLPLFLDEPFDPSPYSPISRLFWSEFYLDIADLPELGECTEARQILSSQAFARRVDHLRHEPLVHYREQMALKRQVLEALSRWFFSQGSSHRRAALEAFLAEHDRVRDYAEFRAVAEATRRPWQEWEPRLREGSLRSDDYRADAYQYHLYVQWCAAAQIRGVAERASKSGLGLYLDLPLGVHSSGYDVWRERSTFLEGCSLGAPPDQAFTTGQDWGTIPLHPEAVRRNHYRYFIDCIRHHLSCAGALRIDHIMGFHRVYCVPHGLSSQEGVYLKYRPDELYAILSIESQRHRALLVGEDLGTVPSNVREQMREQKVHRMHVLQYELFDKQVQDAFDAPSDCVASLNTHDMALFGAWWEGSDIDTELAAGILSKESAETARSDRRKITASVESWLIAAGLLQAPATPSEVLLALLRAYAKSSASFVMVTLEDLWLERARQNLPGTTDQHENWRRKLRYSLEELSHHPRVLEVLRQVDGERSRGGIAA